MLVTASYETITFIFFYQLMMKRVVSSFSDYLILIISLISILGSMVCFFVTIPVFIHVSVYCSGLVILGLEKNSM